MYRRSRSCHTLSSCPRAERQDLVYGFSAGLALWQVGIGIPLSPSLGLSKGPKPPFVSQGQSPCHIEQFFRKVQSPVGWTRTNNLCVRSANDNNCCQNPAQDLFHHRALPFELPPVMSRNRRTRTADLLRIRQTP